jgi:hypothetical protein
LLLTLERIRAKGVIEFGENVLRLDDNIGHASRVRLPECVARQFSL